VAGQREIRGALPSGRGDSSPIKPGLPAHLKSQAQNEGMNTTSNRRDRRLESLAADLVELQSRAAQQRIQYAIVDARRRVARLKPGATILRPYQIESAVRRIGEGEDVLSISRNLHCGCSHIYRALAGMPVQPAS
jgi:hypothetical protein